MRKVPVSYWFMSGLVLLIAAAPASPAPSAAVPGTQADELTITASGETIVLPMISNVQQGMGPTQWRPPAGAGDLPEINILAGAVKPGTGHRVTLYFKVDPQSSTATGRMVFKDSRWFQPSSTDTGNPPTITIEEFTPGEDSAFIKGTFGATMSDGTEVTGTFEGTAPKFNPYGH